MEGFYAMVNRRVVVAVDDDGDYYCSSVVVIWIDVLTLSQEIPCHFWWTILLLKDKIYYYWYQFINPTTSNLSTLYLIATNNSHSFVLCIAFNN